MCYGESHGMSYKCLVRTLDIVLNPSCIYHFSLARLLYRPTITAPRRDARSEADRFLRDFEHTYGTTHPTFFEGGGYTQAITHAKKNLHYALVILCSQEHDDNDSFCKDTLTDDELLEFLRQHKVVVWGGNVRYTEAYQVSNTLQATTYPFLGIIALQNNKMAVIDRIEGPVTPTTMIRRFEAVMTRIEPSLNQLRMEREQRELERRMRQDQDKAYQESLARDQEKERKKEKAKRELQLKEELERKKEMMQKQYIQYLVGLFESRTETATDQPTTKINFRFANGERVICPFYASDSLLSLYQFVEAYPHLNKVEPLNEPPKDYTHEFNFTIHSLFPKTIYEADDTVQIKNIKGLWPSATLIVEE